MNKGAKQNENKQEKNNKKQSAEFKGKCVCCDESHALYKCVKFKTMKVQARRALVNEKQLCILCLQANHKYNECFLKKTCTDCGRKHNDLLHFKDGEIKSQKKEKSSDKNVLTTITDDIIDESESISVVPENVFSHFTYKDSNSMLLATALVKIRTPSGFSEPIRVPIDHASTASFVTQNLMQRLQFKYSKNLTHIRGMGGKLLANSMGTVDIEIFPHFTTRDSVKFSAIVVGKMKELLTTKNLKTKLAEITEIDKLTLADPTFYSSSSIEMILGVDIHAEILI